MVNSFVSKFALNSIIHYIFQNSLMKSPSEKFILELSAFST